MEEPRERFGPAHGGLHGAAASGHVHVTAPPSVSSYERRPSVKLAKSQLRTANANFDNPALEPVVQTQYATRPGEIPRRIQIERKKRLYAEQSLEALLRERGVDTAVAAPSALQAIAPRAAALPLEVFDDEAYEVRSAEAWAAMAAAGGGGLPARALYTLSDSRSSSSSSSNGSTTAAVAQWRECLVTGRDAATGLWSLQWLEGTARECAVQLSKPRLAVYLRAEDPFNFADRVAAAHSRRATAERSLLHALCVDCMPGDGLAELDSEAMNRIMGLCMRSRAVDQTLADCSQLMDQVNMDYLRAMNSIALTAQVKRARAARGAARDPAMELLSQLVLPGEQPARTSNNNNSNNTAAAAPAHGGSSSAGAKQAWPEHPTAGAATASSRALAAGAGGAGGLQPAVRRGTVAIGFHAFDERVSEFCFSSFLTRAEIVKIIVAVRGECQRVGALRLFHTAPKTVRLEEFAAAQAQATLAASTTLKEQWTAAVVAAVRLHLKDVKKGWFNLEETSNEVYRFSKLRAFLQYLNFLMQDTLQFMVADSLRDYARFLKRACLHQVAVKASNDVTLSVLAAAAALNTTTSSTYSSSSSSSTATAAHLFRPLRAPLFSLEIAAVGDKGSQKFAYSHKLQGFSEAALAALDRGLAATQGVVRIERRVMKKLFWSHDPVMANVHGTAHWVQELRSEVAAALEAAVAPAAAYLATLDPLLDFLNLDIESYLSDTEAALLNEETGKFAFEDGLALAQQHRADRTAVESALPETVSLGLFTVAAGRVRAALAAKHSAIADRIIEVVGRRARAAAAAASAKFEGVFRKLHAPVTGIEELTAVEEYMEGCPARVAELGGYVAETKRAFEVLSSAGVHLDATSFAAEWDVYAWPQKIAKRADALAGALSTRRAQYHSEMGEAQQEFVERLKGLADQVSHMSQYTDLSKVGQVSAMVIRVEGELEECVKQARLFNAREALFSASTKPGSSSSDAPQQTEYTQLAALQKAFEPYCDLWKRVADWIAMKRVWLSAPFLELDADAVEKGASLVSRGLNKAARFFETAGLEGCSKIARSVKAEVDEFMPFVPVVVALRTPGMRPRHWDALSEKLGIDLHPDATYTLTKLIESKLHEKSEPILRVSETAGKEFAIESSLNKMRDAWAAVTLQVEPYRNTGTGILHGVDEAMALVDEHVTATQAMTFSAFKGPFEDRITDWDAALAVVSEVLDEWVAVQRAWLYLQPIFDSPDINKQLPLEGKRFASVDKHWRSTMTAAAAGGGAPCVKFCNSPKLLEKLRESARLLETVQKGLSDYLETKRAGFSRFYFLSNDELLEILSQTKDPLAVQPHLKKCFEGIKSVDFTADNTIVAMNSAEGEKVPFLHPVDPRGKSVEAWMSEVCAAMCASVREQVRLGVIDYAAAPRTQWMQQWPGQVVLNGSQVHWTSETEAAMRTKGNAGVHEYHTQLVAQLSDMVFLIRGDLSTQARVTIGALAVIDVHARDVVEKMAAAGVSNASDFDWYSQMRFYWKKPPAGTASSAAAVTTALSRSADDDNGDLKVVMVSSERDYGYEYLGNSFRLVITPLTDKCYLTIMSALQMILGGAPAGPAGTGKTETTKDLAKALAKQCVVFNCSDGLDYMGMGKFFKGLASSGAWACFDEFNRINIEVLSVVAQQIMTLQGAVQRGEKRCVFEETDILVNPEFAVFITMNPGYAGRSELPDNLEALFRPVAMMVPDYALIGEIMLFSYGYLENRKCAQKMVATFRLCSEQLSAQDHYDYGMRAVKTVITAAGNLKRASPGASEEALLLRALQDVNVPKFLAHDLPLFQGILGDLFPGIERPPFDYGPLNSALKLAAQDLGLQPVPSFITKTVELYEMVCVRHGLMVVGPTGGGKSSNIRVLADALTALKNKGVPGVRFERVDTCHLNPKSITMGQLYGEFDANTHEWRDGVLADTVRACSRKTTPDLQWVLFDGPVDAIWIENMNTVLDDNKKLCLTSGEIMSLSEPMTMMFEPEDLSVASPATVSRCGMIYMEPRSLGLDALVQSWIAQLPPALRTPVKVTSSSNGKAHQTSGATLLSGLFDAYMVPLLSALRRFCSEPLPSVDNCLVQGLMNLLDCHLESFRPVEGVCRRTADDVKTLVTTHLESVFMFALVWSLAATVDAKGRLWMNQYLRSEMANNECARPFPDEGTIYDYKYSEEACEGSGSWIGWMDSVEVYKLDPKLGFSELIVPTADSICYTFLLDQLVRGGKHVLLSGPTGTGKTSTVNAHLQGGLAGDAYVPLCLTFSAQTSANQTQDLIDSKCEKRKKGVFGPSAGKQFVLFVDDINMPQRETYGAQPPIELLRQWFDNGGWYDRAALTFRQIVDVIMVCACGPPGGGRNPVTARFYRHFNIISCTPMSESATALIFGTIFGGFAARFPSEECRALATPLVAATTAIFSTILADLRPTPAKSHYTYNLRDLSKVFQGLLMADPRRVGASPAALTRLWLHECDRVFADRLTCTEDKSWFAGLTQRHVSASLGLDWSTVTEQQQQQDSSSASSSSSSAAVFVDFMIPGADPKVYEEVKDRAALQSTVEEFLGEYNADTKQPMPLVMFEDAVAHVCRVSRVLRQPQGNALLLGVGGSGRQSLTRLACFMADFELCQVEITKNYGRAEWHEDLRRCLLRAGVDDKSVVLLLSDTQIVEEGMLEDVNNVLNSGDVPNLYGAEDMERIVTACRPLCARRRVAPTRLNIFAQYLQRVRANVHLVLCMSPLGEAFRTRLRMFPSLVNCCAIDWFMEWPDEALESVARRTLGAEAQGNDSSSSGADLGPHEDAVVASMKHMHQSVAAAAKDFLSQARRYTYVTPTSYLEVLSTYKAVLKQKRTEVGTLRDRLQIGLDKIVSTKAQVGGLQAQLTEMEPVLIRTQADVEALIVQITRDTMEAAKTRGEVQAQEADAQAKAAATRDIAADAQRDLDEALPALDAAVACLKDLKKADIDEVKSLGKPPYGVKLTMQATCIMFDVKPDKVADPDAPGKKINDYFSAAKRAVLSNANKLLADMQSFDKDNIPDKVIKAIDPFMADPDFEPKQIEKASKACTAICMWVRAMHVYHNVALQVEPKRQLLREKQVELDSTLAELAAAQTLLSETLAKVAALEASFEEANAKKEKLMRDVEECRARLDRAQKLIGGLGGEKDRWTESVARLSALYDCLVGDAVVSAGMIAYAGPFTPDFRQKLVKDWQAHLVAVGVPHSPGCDARTTLSDPVLVRSWAIAGLPSDGHSIENAIFMARARRYPLLIDPQGQANRYIKTMGRDPAFSLNGLDVVKLSDKGLLRALENGIRFGRWVLIESVLESLDAALEPVLLQQKFRQGGTEMIRVGDSTIPWNNQFRLFMTTKLSNPHYPPDICVKVSVVNFAITFTGLEDQLLGVVVVEEMPEMEERKNSLVARGARMRRELADIENRILFLLSNSTGNILDDHELIETLASSKKTSTEIAAKVAEASATEAEIDATRELYRPVAYRGAILYFCIRDLGVVDPMYQYSLQWFTGLFVTATRRGERAPLLSDRLRDLSEVFTYYVYTSVCRSLFEKDKLLFSFLMAIRVLQGSGGVDPAEWRFLITGEALPTTSSSTTTAAASASSEGSTTTAPAAPTLAAAAVAAAEAEAAAFLAAAPNPAPEWIDGRMWKEVKALSSLPAFKGLARDFEGSLRGEFKAMYDHAEPQLLQLPGGWGREGKLDALQKLCLLRCVRADKVPQAIMSFVTGELGQAFVEPPPFSLPACYADSSALTPLVFVLSKGSDPTKAFYQFAAAAKFDKKVKGLSLGQGQGAKAARLIEDAVSKGTWVYLQNCHLYISWLPELERLCEELTPETVHKDFRLWLTSMPCAEFPVSVLQGSVKMTNEPPKGLRANLKAAYYKLDSAALEATQRPEAYKRLLFALCFFHANVQERRRFGPLGWNVPYEFNETDLDISRGQLEIFLDTSDSVPYRVLRFLTAYINYGGRVTDYIDLRTIDVIMRAFYTPRVLEPGASYSFDADGVYPSPDYDPSDPHRSYVEFIDSLPLTAGPGAFGMHENANISCALAETFATFGTVLKMEAGGSSSSSGSSGSGDEAIAAAARAMAAQLAQRGAFDLEAIASQFPTTYSESMNTVLAQECARYNRLTGEMSRALPELCRALAGLVVMSAELEALARAVALNAVPAAWEARAYPSLKPLGAWIEDLCARLDFLRAWGDAGAPPPVYWLSGLYFPQAFLTGTLQNYARKRALPIDTVAFDYCVRDDLDWESVVQGPEDGAYVRGLFLEGARWSTAARGLDDSKPKQLYTPLPVLHLRPVRDRVNPDSGVYRCPVYKVLSRRGTLSTTGHSTNFVMWVDLPSNREDTPNNVGNSDQEVWVKAGVACFCSLAF